MAFEKLTLKSVAVRPVLVPLRRPVVSKVGSFEAWPMILIDLMTEQGVVGRSYLEPYLRQATRSIVSLIHELSAPRIGRAELSPGITSRATAPNTTENPILLIMHLFSGMRTANGAVRTKKC